MKKTFSTIVAIGFVSSMLVNTAYAGHRDIEVLNPLWLPIAILSTAAAVIQAPFVYENREYQEPRQTVIYEEPRHYRQYQYYDRSYEEPRYYRQDRYNDRDRAYGEPRYRGYR
ncbi:MAG: hypothetical protein ACYC2U_07745 [Candidatus Amoebophilus sp.]